MKDLQSKLKNGEYKIPRDIEISFDCMHFLNECLRYDQSRRPDYGRLLDHLFIKRVSDYDNCQNMGSFFQDCPNVGFRPRPNESIAMNVR